MGRLWSIWYSDITLLDYSIRIEVYKILKFSSLASQNLMPSFIHSFIPSFPHSFHSFSIISDVSQELPILWGLNEIYMNTTIPRYVNVQRSSRDFHQMSGELRFFWPPLYPGHQLPTMLPWLCPHHQASMGTGHSIDDLGCSTYFFTLLLCLI